MKFKTDFQIFKSDFFLSQIFFFSKSDFFLSQIFLIFKSQKFCETEINRGKLKIVFSEAAQERFSKKYQLNTF